MFKGDDPSRKAQNREPMPMCRVQELFGRLPEINNRRKLNFYMSTINLKYVPL